ncbi:protein rolling stone-like [Dendronephthya gigantea]|uniref:protein rolling stone-like n=1 Tax=Dendronephthya gigantea TaxID=151771 RepID=UPI00106BE3B0|nr:protein rolling stone-like [Dendronephthya gigantea]
MNECSLQILSPRSLLLLRLTLATFCTAITIASGVLKADPRWFIYLTNWSFLLLTVTMIGLTLVSIIREYENISSSTENASQEMRNCGAIITANAECASSQNNANKVGPSPTSLTWYEKGVWILWIVSSNAALVVTLNYWLLVFQPPTDFMDIAVHALNSFVMLVEFFMSKTPVRILHVLYVMIFAIVYSLFSVIFWAAGGVNVKVPLTQNAIFAPWKVLDYENGEPAVVSAVLLGIIFLISPILQLTLFGLHRLKQRYLRKKRDAIYGNINLAL